MTPRARLLGLSLVTCATLLAEVALTRVLSVSLFHHFAFLVVSTAVLGTGAAGVALATGTRLARLDADRLAGFGGLGFAVALPAAFSATMALRLEPLRLAEAPSEVVALGAAYLLLSLPFFASGLAVASLLARFASDAPRLYAADLAGASVGSFLALGALVAVGGLGALLVASALAAASGAVFLGGRMRTGAAALAVAAAALSPFGEDLLPLSISQAKQTAEGEPFERILRDPRRTLDTRYSSIGRVDLVDFGPGRQRLVIDGGVAAVRIPPPDLRPPRSDTTLPYELRPGAKVLIIGAGAGWEVAEAVAFGAIAVDAVELSADILRHVPAPLKTKPGVRFVLAEGRSWLESTDDRYDAIIMIHTISNAATAAGAMHLAEDFLLTRQALEALLDHLRPDGFLLITRPEAQLPRLLTTLRAATPEPLQIFVWAEAAVGASFYGATLVSRALRDGDSDAIVARIRERGRLRLIAAPGAVPADPLYQMLLDQRTPIDLATLEALAGARLDPAVDDRPFFNQRRRFSELRFADVRRALGIDANARLALEDQPLAEISTVVLLVETTVLGAVLLVLPLLLGRRRGTRISGRTFVTNFVYFSCLGVGFMVVEIVLVQRLGLLLGQPGLTFAVVLAGVLAGAGLGSHLSARLARPARAPIYAAGAAVALAALLPFLLPPLLGWPELARIGVSLAIVVPVGAVLGAPFPLGLVRASAQDPALPAWAFAANGVASIAGTVIALVVASEAGFTGASLVAAASYVIAALTFPRSPAS